MVGCVVYKTRFELGAFALWLEHLCRSCVCARQPKAQGRGLLQLLLAGDRGGKLLVKAVAVVTS